MVTIRMPISGRSTLISRVASRPSIPGMRTSMRIRSGTSERPSSTASRPSLASPTISRSGSRLRSPRSPRRTRSWSSAIRSRFRSPLLFSIEILGHHDAGAADDAELPAEQGDPLAHPGQADPLAGAAAAAPGHEAPPVVPYLQPDPATPVGSQRGGRTFLEGEIHALGARVLADVVERLLHDPEDGGLGRGGKPFVVEAVLVVYAPPVGPQGVEVEPYRAPQAEVVQRRGPQVRDDPARLADGLAHQLGDVLEVIAAFLGGRRVVVCKSLQVLMSRRRDLRQAVVHLVGYSAALLLLGDQYLADQLLQPLLAFGQLPVEPGVLQGARRLVRQALQDLDVVLLGQLLGAVHLQNADRALSNLERQAQPDGGRSPRVGWFEDLRRVPLDGVLFRPARAGSVPD